MAKVRKTYSDNWFRIAEQKPRLLTTIKVHRQHFRGELWYVLENPVTNEFLRLNQTAYEFLGRLDGRHTVDQAWEACQARFADQAPTQDEAINLLGQLYQSNSLQASVGVDVEATMNLKRQRNQRQIQGQMANFFFAKIPLWDPDHFLERWILPIRAIMHPVGLFLVAMLCAVAIGMLITSDYSLFDPPATMLSTENMILVGVLFWVVKLIHEFGHGFLCKYFGHQAHGGGEVHTMGVMMMVLTPLPFVDTTSSSALKSKWQRMSIGAGGMFVELILAAIFAIVWVLTPRDATMHLIAYNLMLITSVTTLLFNANPLMRFDGYYILSDWLEFPNLRQQSQNYLKYLFKRYLWGMDEPNPARSGFTILFLYGSLSIIYKLLLFFFITWGVMQFSVVLGALIGVVMGITSIVKPLFSLLAYLISNPALGRHRPRAIVTSGLIAAGIVYLITGIPMGYHAKAHGVLEAREQLPVTTKADGTVVELHPASASVKPNTILVVLENPALKAEERKVAAQREIIRHQRNIALAQSSGDPSTMAQIDVLDEQLVSLEAQHRRLQEQIDSLRVVAKDSVDWTPDVKVRGVGSWCQAGQPIGIARKDGDWWLRVVLPMDVVGDTRELKDEHIDLLIGARSLTGTVDQIIDVGTRRLPNVSLSTAGGGTIATDAQQREVTTEAFFELRIRVPEQDVLYEGQVVTALIDLPPRSIAHRAWRGWLQIWQRRLSS